MGYPLRSGLGVSGVEDVINEVTNTQYIDFSVKSVKLWFRNNKYLQHYFGL
ncbi:hypothetical protein [Flavobacterium sp.]|uniref:hypothetical protein n=1 Tax=Flavobacterium sp. TaxID=239 RepID=UPI002629E0A7|nr:hypothetical protein [Flavobacterium sp.]